jgi:hypothetical protein
MPRAPPPAPERARRPAVAEVEGFLAGLTEALARLRRAGAPRPELEQSLAEAAAELRRGRAREALAGLVRVDEALRAAEEESELTEFPRGLVGYVPRGARGAPLPPEEEPLAHRRRLVLHLAELVELPPSEHAQVIAELALAEQEIARGERARAKERIDAVHQRIEEAGARQRPPPE